MTRITTKLEFKDEFERNYFQNTAKQLGFKSFKEFAVKSMNKYINDNSMVMQFTGNFKRDIKLEIENSSASLYIDGNLYNKIEIPYNHCGCGFGDNPIQHRGYPNNINDFEFNKVIAAIELILKYNWAKTKTFNKDSSSYGIKHSIESSHFYQAACENNCGQKYKHLGNGELILAMQLLKYEISKPFGQNVYFKTNNVRSKKYYAKYFGENTQCFD